MSVNPLSFVSIPTTAVTEAGIIPGRPFAVDDGVLGILVRMYFPGAINTNSLNIRLQTFVGNGATGEWRDYIADTSSRGNANDWFVYFGESPDMALSNNGHAVALPRVLRASVNANNANAATFALDGVWTR